MPAITPSSKPVISPRRRVKFKAPVNIEIELNHRAQVEIEYIDPQGEKHSYKLTMGRYGLFLT